MSQRHRSQDVAPPPKMDLRAHAHNERHRINSELHALASQVSAGLEPEDAHEPGRAWVPEHHRSADRVHSAPRQPRHWKMKMWKRRTAVRRAKAQAFRLAGAGD
jgi:hypothetical protein